MLQIAVSVFTVPFSVTEVFKAYMAFDVEVYVTLHFQVYDFSGKSSRLGERFRIKLWLHL